jgi:aspartate aminotransferase-like enzyme
MENHSLLLTVGPLEMDEKILQKGAEKIPYFRTNEFSDINLSICEGIKKIVFTSEDSKVALLTSSGTGAMEAAVINTFNEKDHLLVIVGGGFGKRFVEICETHNIPYTSLKLENGQALSQDMLNKYRNKGYTGVLVNAHETSTCVYYDLQMIGQYCKEEGCIFVVDAISSFLADIYLMDDWNIDITIISSQKALALPPGISILVVNEKTAKKIFENKSKSIYFDLKKYFIDMKRGQTPFTPAVGIILQLKARVDQILDVGVEKIVNNTKEIAQDFRNKIKDFPFNIPSESLSNAATPLQTCGNSSAEDIVMHLVKKYKIFVNPNGSDLKHKLFRVGHIGNLTTEDNDRLIRAFKEMRKDGIL